MSSGSSCAVKFWSDGRLWQPYRAVASGRARPRSTRSGSPKASIYIRARSTRPPTTATWPRAERLVEKPKRHGLPYLAAGRLPE